MLLTSNTSTRCMFLTWGMDATCNSCDAGMQLTHAGTLGRFATCRRVGCVTRLLVKTRQLLGACSLCELCSPPPGQCPSACRVCSKPGFGARTKARCRVLHARRAPDCAAQALAARPDCKSPGQQGCGALMRKLCWGARARFCRDRAALEGEKE
jgi:hypothetical protein